MIKAQQVGPKHPPLNHVEHKQEDAVRLNKYLSEAGASSRRGADRLIQEGVVAINGKPAEVGMSVYEDDIVTVHGKEISNQKHRFYIALNKPRGITSTTDPKDPTNIVSYINHPETIFPIGRLDKDSFGLILLTNDGDVVNKILREEHGHDKEYDVSVHKKYDASFVPSMEKGVEIYNQAAHRHETTKTCTVIPTGASRFTIILKQGLNRQIRRMTKALGYRVTSLKRTRIMNIHLGDLKQGQWRYLTSDEVSELNALLSKQKG